MKCSGAVEDSTDNVARLGHDPHVALGTLHWNRALVVGERMHRSLTVIGKTELAAAQLRQKYVEPS